MVAKLLRAGTPQGNFRPMRGLGKSPWRTTQIRSLEALFVASYLPNPCPHSRLTLRRLLSSLNGVDGHLPLPLAASSQAPHT
jgi:hypothetical protein